MERIIAGISRYFQGWSTMDPAGQLGLFGAGGDWPFPEYPAWAADGPASIGGRGLRRRIPQARSTGDMANMKDK